MNDTVIFLVLAGLALVFKWLTNKGSGDAENPPDSEPNEPIQRAPLLTEEERVRRFLEALGVPPGTRAPPPVRPRTATPPPIVTAAPPPIMRRSWAQPLPPVLTTPEDPLPPLTTAPLPEPVFVSEAPSPPPAVFIPPPLPATFASKPLSASFVRTAAPPRPLPKGSLGVLLRSKESIRQAIILREVLGPPLGLEPFGRFPGR